MNQVLHDTLTIGLPTTVILAGFIWQNGRFSKLETKMDRGFEVVHIDLRRFYHMLGELKGRVDTMEKR